MVTVKAPAKINLTLEVLRKRPDGFHEIRNVLQTIDLCDTFYLKISDEVVLRCDMPGWSAEKSLLTKAVDLLKKVTGCSHGVMVEIEKRIPLMSGLGGDSSDAAALLRGLNQLWKLRLSIEKLQELAAQLGSDVTFFLSGRTALAEGRGEIITPLPAIKRIWVVLVVPEVPGEHGKTGRMYAALKPEHFTDGKMTEKLVQALHKDNYLDTSMLFNAFENIAFDIYPGLTAYRESLFNLGVPHVHLAGSGPTLFTIMPDVARAEEIYEKCKSQGIKAHLAASL
jgi:4-diphosphocytidyl-2-C-methyl-D-erythritol kinase